MSDDRPIVSEDFKKLMEQKRNSNGLSGVDVCDVQDCYCKNEVVYATSKSGTGSVTPVQEESGSVTPKEPTKEKPNKTTKKLKKVKRALKTLGVNFLTFDEANEKNSNKNGVDQCEKEYCRLGKFVSVY